MKTKFQMMLMLIASIGILAISSCKKEEKKKIKEFQETIDFLTQNNWRLYEFNIKEIMPEYNEYSEWNECIKDNILIFTTSNISDTDAESLRASGTWKLTDGATQCNPDSTISISGTWEYIPNGDTPDNIISDKAFWNGANAEVFHYIIELNTSVFKIEWDSPNGRVIQIWKKAN